MRGWRDGSGRQISTLSSISMKSANRDCAVKEIESLIERKLKFQISPTKIIRVF